MQNILCSVISFVFKNTYSKYVCLYLNRHLCLHKPRMKGHKPAKIGGSGGELRRAFARHFLFLLSDSLFYINVWLFYKNVFVYCNINKMVIKNYMGKIPTFKCLSKIRRCIYLFRKRKEPNVRKFNLLNLNGEKGLLLYYLFNFSVIIFFVI